MSTMEEQILACMSDEWTSPSDIIAKTGISGTLLAAGLRKLENDGKIFPESRGGRIRLSPAPPEAGELNVDVEIIDFLDDQWEPATPNQVAKRLYVPLRQVKTALNRLQREKHVICVQEEATVDDMFVPSLWCSL